jgi:hypothetical protein
VSAVLIRIAAEDVPLALKEGYTRLRSNNMTDSEIIFTVTENPEGVFEAAALGHSIFTEADTFEELKDTVKNAVRCHFEEDDRPRVIRLHLVKDVVLPV